MCDPAWNTVGFKTNNGFDRVYTETGLTGNGVEIGMIESSYPSAPEGISDDRIVYVGSNLGTLATDNDHSTGTLSVFCGDYGLIPNVKTVYCASRADTCYPSDAKFFYAMEDLVRHEVNIINSSMNIGYRGENEDYKLVERWLDYICYKYDITYVQSAGNGALMLELKPSLAVRPQTIKAILLASCHRKAGDPSDSTLDESMLNGLTEKQGAGVVDCYNALCIVGNSQYGEREITETRDSDSVRIVQPKYSNEYINFAISWSHQNSLLIDKEYPTPTMIHNDIDDLCLTATSLRTDVPEYLRYLGFSDHINSSTEMVYIPLSEDILEYKFIVEKVEPNENNIVYGYAWSTDSMKYEDVGNEGLFYLKNRRSKHYLDVNTSGNLYQIQDLGNELKYCFFEETEDNKYKINVLDKGYLGVGDVLDTNVYGAPINTDNAKEYLLEENLNGTYYIQNEINNSGLTNYFQILNYAYTPETEACWGELHLASAAQWYFERINFQKGDIDMNGIIDFDDAMIIDDFLLGGDNLSDVQFFLADLDKNEIITRDDFCMILDIYYGE